MGTLRFILALSVVCIHCGKLFGKIRMVESTVAVESFFMISGFYMSMVLNQKYTLTPKGYWLFLSNRFLRLFPIYWIIAGATWMLYLLKLPSIKGDFSLLNNPTSLFLVFSNISLFFQDWVYYFGLNPTNGSLFFTHNFWTSKPMLYQYMLLPQGWSVSLELLFYIICPFLIHRKNKALLLLICASLLLRLSIYIGLTWNNDPWTYRFFPSELLFFIAGILVDRYANQWLHLKMNAHLLLALIVLFAITYTKIPSIQIPYWPFSFKASTFFLLIIYAMPFLFNQFKNNPIDRYLGELSYPMYMSHILVFYITQIPSLLFLHQATSMAFITLLFSMLLIQFVAKPIEKYRQSRVIALKK